ncbi:hypothetical protein BaRGS_00004467 [Batillaria attramentaria]|uniref:Rhodanese domain-containing protein n=1 Tax=Batillaria attramentaria TaxID=370345 RepID=A0ABD0LYG0_9CAEN
MTILRVGTVVSTHWLRDQLLSLKNVAKHRPMRVLDVSSTMDPEVDGYKEFYQQSHIPESLHISIHKLCPPSNASLHKFPVPDSNRFQDVVESLGICNSTHVITYDRSDTKFALKIWWLFRLFGHNRVSVLDGGFKKWLTDGFEVTVDEPKVQRSLFRPAFNPELLQDYDDMVKHVALKSHQLVDARPPDWYKGSGERPLDVVGGHIPGAKNIPYAALFNEDGTFKSQHELKKVFDAGNVDLGRPIVASCQTAMTACGLAAAACILGKETVPIYNGSFLEWSQRAEPHQIELD